MLAPVQGNESWLSMGTGHMNAFCRAANHGCKTNIAFLADASGIIDVAALKRQKDFKTMLERGWRWLQLPWQVEAAWPSSPSMFQQALNGSNDIASSASELEGAVSMAESLQQGRPEAEAIQAATAGSPPWTTYAPIILKLAKFFGGGVKAPLLYQLDRFAKTLGEDRRLGEEFLTAIVTLKWQGSKEYPRVVDALLTCNMVSARIFDGIARTITKTDITALSTKAKMVGVVAADKQLEEVAEYCKQLMVAEFDENAVLNAEGLFKCRVGAHLCGKGKLTFEGRVFKELDDIVREFLKEVASIIPDGSAGVVLCKEWQKDYRDDSTGQAANRGCTKRACAAVDRTAHEQHHRCPT